MCGRFVNFTTFVELQKQFALTNNINYGPSYNIAPSQEVPIIIGHEAKLAKWGYIPEWAKSKDIKPQINARSETAHEKPFFRSGFKSRRCLVPINGFFEWEQTPQGKQPWYFYNPNEILAIGGLYYEGTFCLLTKDSDGVVSSIHDRMPVLIPKELYAEWFSAGKEEAQRLITQCNGLALAGHRVSMKINSPANNQEALLASI